MTAVFKLTPSVQTYDWGKLGRASKVAQLAERGTARGFTLDESTPYAELWMGTHPNSPSHLAESDTPLKAHLAAHPALLGSAVAAKFRAHDGDVPFLFKVLSIRKALSIQTHPDKPTAERLHAAQPHIYKDDNHKPEMAIALTPFTALCGFLPLPEIASNLTSTPEFAALVPPTIASTFLELASSAEPEGPKEKMALRDVFAAVMTAPPAEVQMQLATLVARYKTTGPSAGEKQDIADLAVTLNEQFPGDIGVFCAFLLNYLKLEPGEAIFLGAGEPHAYVSGDIMECMATSDNVIRAGLTPKLRDIPNLVSGLTYTAGHHSKHMVEPQSFSPHSLLYDPPIPEFSVLKVDLNAGEKDGHKALAGPSIVAVCEGKGTVGWGADSVACAAGDVLFIGAGVEASFAGQDNGLTLYRAFVEA